MYPLWDQIKAFMQSISGIVHKQAETLDRTTATLDETTVTANEAHEAALYSRERIDGKMDSVNPIGKGAFIMNPRNVNEYGEDSSSLGWGAATGNYAHAEGSLTEAKGKQSHAEGNTTKANGNESHAEGLNTEANGTAGHAEGGYTVSGGRSLDSGFMGASYAHAEGVRTDASGTASHAEGSHTTASLEAAHAEGKGTKARSDYSHAEGYCTEVASKTAIAQHVQGKANIVDAEGKYAHIVGNGEATYNADGTFTIDKASNAHTLDWDGNAWFQGNVYVGGAGQEDKNASKLIAQKDIGKGLKMDGDVLTVDEGEYELIEEIIVGYELLTAKPEDWETSWTEYHVRTVDSYKESTFSQITAETPPEWENGKYYKSVEVIGNIYRTAEPNGKKYNIKAAWIEFEIPTATDSGYVTITFYTADASGGIYIGNGIKSASKSFYHTFALPLYGYINGWATRPVTGKTQQAAFEGPLNHRGLYLKANPFVGIRIQTNSEFPAGSIIKIRAVRA